MLAQPLREALANGRGLVLAPDWHSGQAAIAALPKPTLIDPYRRLSSPFQTLDWVTLRDLNPPPGALITGLGARPWDDPMWWSALPALVSCAVVLLPARFQSRFGGALLPRQAAGSTSKGSESDWPALLTPSTPLDDETPLLRGLVAQSPPTERPARLLRLAEHLMQYGRSGSALMALREAVSLTAAGAQAGDPQRLHDRAALLDALGDCAASRDELDATESAYRASEETSAALLAVHPAADTRWGAAVSGLRSAGLLQARGRYAQAAARIRAALAAARDPHERATISARLAQAQETLGDLQGALDTLQDPAATVQAQLTLTPRRFDLRAQRLRLNTRRAALLIGLNRLRLAEQTAQHLLPDAIALLRRDSYRFSFLAAAAAAAVVTADLRLATGRPAALPLRTAEALYTRLIDRDPNRAAPVCERARVRRRLVYCGDRDAEQTAFDTTQRLLQRHPQDPGRAHDLSLALMTRAYLTETDNRPQSALSLWRQALATVPDGLPAFERTKRRCQQATARLSEVY